jgi:carboxylesterase
VIEPNALDLLSEHLAAAPKETLWLERSGHVITLDVEHAIVYERVGQFIKGLEE